MPELTAGTVAFLFTDVEGSTRLLQAHPRAYPRAIARHHELLAAAVTDHDGVVFETIGDAVYASFTKTEAAARAAVAGQRALAAEDWGELGGLRVRMGIHTGDVEVRGSHYFGPALYRCARLMAAAHGGQVLVTEVAAGILRDAAPDEIGLRDLGEHRLKDLQRGERIFQLLALGLPADFPPPRTLDARPNNLPLLPTATVGRTRELSEARALLMDPATRILTFTGPGGTGKTRLALALAAEAVEQFADGVFFVPLAPIAAAEFLIPAIASALAIRETPGRSLTDSVTDHLRGRRLLLVLDNFEHLLEAAPRIAEMLGAIPGLTALVTSQSPLRLYGEREYRVPPLSVARGDGSTDPEQNDAVRLFFERCREIRSDFGRAPDDAAVALQICRRLDGLPLAIELAAARSRVLAPRALLDRLDRRLELLTSGPRDAPQRQRTLRATLEWSHELLDETERRVFRRLAVFSGGCELVAAERVVGPDGDRVLDALASLSEKSLIETDGERASMLETIREFAREQLDQHEETDALMRGHAEHYAGVAQSAEPHLRRLAQLDWAAKLDADRENLRAALRWSVSAEPSLAVRLAADLCMYWFLRGEYTEAAEWAEAALEATGGGDEPRRAWLATWAGYLAAELKDRETGIRRLEEGVALARRTGDPLVLTVATGARAAVRGYTDDDVLAISEVDRLAEDHGDPWVIGHVAMTSGEMYRLRGHDGLALESYERALTAFRRTGDRMFISTNAMNAGHMRLRRGELTLAEELFDESQRLAREVGDPWMLAYLLVALAGLHFARGDHARVATLIAAAEASLERAGMELQATDRADRDRFIAAARSALGEERFARASRDGASLSLDAALAIATGED